MTASFILEPVNTVVEKPKEVNAIWTCEWRSYLQVGFAYTGGRTSGWKVSAGVKGAIGSKKGSVEGSGGIEVYGSVTGNWIDRKDVRTVHHLFKMHGKEVAVVE